MQFPFEIKDEVECEWEEKKQEAREGEKRNLPNRFRKEIMNQTEGKHKRSSVCGITCDWF